MQVSVTDAKAQLTDLVRRAEAGEEVVLTRHGKPTVRLAAVAVRPPRRAPKEAEALKQRLLAIGRDAAREVIPGPDAAHSADFLYDEDGLPQ